ncbi:hypothetical protein ABT063_28500 [Streptomyces sp. NPDC002838]|uniref:hypothetical protein n=1 Tax=Streptomyces sp. NPDC002838 TaxID=3154436 RepID=UPI00332063DA
MQPSYGVVLDADHRQFHPVGVPAQPQALVAQQYFDVRMAVGAVAQDLFQGGLVDEHLRRMTMTARGGVRAEEGAAARVESSGRSAGMARARG